MPRKKKGQSGQGGKKKGKGADKQPESSDARPRGSGPSTEHESARALMSRESPMA